MKEETLNQIDVKPGKMRTQMQSANEFRQAFILKSLVSSSERVTNQKAMKL